jgi:aromatic-L-amino-acid/L-tryptophan decarboxylase
VTTVGDASSLELDAPREDVLLRAAALITEAWKSFDRARPGQPVVDDQVRAMLREPLPEAAEPVTQALGEAAQILDESIAQPRPRYFAFVGSSGLPIGVIGDALASCYDVNLAVYSGAASDIEEQAVRWVGELIGFPVGGGAFTSGGTISNLSALAAARERALPGTRTSGMAAMRPAVYCSKEVHYSIMRAVELLGIGGVNVRALPMDDRRRLRPDALAAAIDGDLAAGVTPVAVVATAGTTLTGAIDPIAEIARICDERNVWLHVDGAYGLAAASLPSMAETFAGLERADSVSLDAHKWLYLPKACGVVLVRRREDLHHSFAHDEGYLPHEREEPHAVDVTLEYSRPFRALKLWLAFRVHGAEAFRRALARNLAQAKLLHAEVLRYRDLEPLGEPQLSIVPFRHVPEGVSDLNAHNARLGYELQRDARVFVAPAVIDGAVYLRPCIVNFRTSDDDVLALVQIAREVGESIAREGVAGPTS